jgi:uncharacterized protein (DUF779 family)
MAPEGTTGFTSLAGELARRLRQGRGPRNQMVLGDEVVDLGPADGVPVVIYLPRGPARPAGEERS